MWPSPPPSARARSTYGRSRIESTCERTRREVPGHEVNPITMMIVMSEGPRIAARMMASASQGTTRAKSVKRMSPVSTAPPR